MKNLIAAVLFVVALPAMAQVRYPVPFPVPTPWPYPPQQQCFGERYDRISALTQAGAQDKLDRFAAEKGVNCTLTSSSLDYATGRCEQVTGELFAVLKMSFNIDCMSRTVSSNLRKTVIKYYR